MPPSTHRPTASWPRFPVLAATNRGSDEYALTQLQELSSPATPPRINSHWLVSEASARGRTLVTVRTTAQQAYQDLLRELAGTRLHVPVSGYWSVGPTSYRRSATGALIPVQVRNGAAVFDAGPDTATSMDNEDNQYRAITVHAAQEGAFTGAVASPQLIGTFSPAKVKSFDPLSQVPLGAYQPVAAAPADCGQQGGAARR